MKEYAGIPDMAAPDQPQWKYAYAFAPVWDANFTGCTWKISECMDPLPASRDCVIYECPAGVVACPPNDLPECPGRNLMGCGTGPNSTSRYWQHPCNPLVTPQDRGITFWCALNGTGTGTGPERRGFSASIDSRRFVSDSPSDTDGGHLCYWTQPGVIPSFAVTCHVGNCLYDDIDDDAAAMCPDASFTPPEFWTGDFVTKIAMFGLALSLVCLATLYVKVENKALYSLEPHTDAFEQMIAAASMPRPLDQHPPHHVRTVSMVVGTRGRRRHARDSTLESMPEEDAADDDDARATTISWESVHVYAARVTPSRPSGAMKTNPPERLRIRRSDAETGLRRRRRRRNRTSGRGRGRHDAHNARNARVLGRRLGRRRVGALRDPRAVGRGQVDAARFSRRPDPARAGGARDRQARRRGGIRTGGATRERVRAADGRAARHVDGVGAPDVQRRAAIAAGYG